MKTLTFSITTLVLFALMSCTESTVQKGTSEEQKVDSAYQRKLRIENLLRMEDNFRQDLGQTGYSGWYCPDNVRGFPPVDIKSWAKVPVVNGRLPTYEETQNGKSLIYYDSTKNPDAKAYSMHLPRLASFFCSYTNKTETVIVIQLVQTATDTVAGYRFVTGGNGTSNFRDLHFFTDEEIKQAVGNTL